MPFFATLQAEGLAHVVRRWRADRTCMPFPDCLSPAIEAGWFLPAGCTRVVAKLVPAALILMRRLARLEQVPGPNVCQLPNPRGRPSARTSSLSYRHRPGSSRRAGSGNSCALPAQPRKAGCAAGARRAGWPRFRPRAGRAARPGRNGCHGRRSCAGSARRPMSKRSGSSNASGSRLAELDEGEDALALADRLAAQLDVGSPRRGPGRPTGRHSAGIPPPLSRPSTGRRLSRSHSRRCFIEWRRPLPIRLVVVSWPANSSRMQVPPLVGRSARLPRPPRARGSSSASPAPRPLDQELADVEGEVPRAHRLFGTRRRSPSVSPERIERRGNRRPPSAG